MPLDSSGFTLTDKQSDLAKLLSSTAKHSLIYGGSRSGKTFLYVWAIILRAIKAPGSRHAIFRRHGVAVKQSIGKDTFPKVMDLAFPGVPYKWHEQDGYFTVGEEGSEVWLAGLDDKERVDKVLGKEFATLYFNEASEIPYASYLVAQTRLAQKVARIDGRILPLKSYVDLNPTNDAHWTYSIYVRGVEPQDNQPVNVDDYAVGMANPSDNAANLSQDYLDTLAALPERQRKRFWDGEYSGDAEDALWRRSIIKRWHKGKKLPDFVRVVVGVDPAASTEIGSDETGIVAAALDADGNAYVLDDASGRYKPEEWAKASVATYKLHDADRIVAEKNNGGDMVESVIRSQGRDVPVKMVWASRGKVTRAEPVAALYERGKVFHVDVHQELEDQMCAMTVNFDRKAQGYSPDRVDALVWALTDLFPAMTRKSAGAKDLPLPQLGTIA